MSNRSLFPRQLLSRVAGTAIVLGLGTLVIGGYVHGRSEAALEAQRERPVKAPLRVSMEDGKPVISLDAQTEERSAIEASTLEPAAYRDQVRAYGTVLDLARLIELNNSYANARAQREMAEAKLGAAKTALDRAKKLYEDQQNVSLAQLQAAQASFRTDQAALNAAESQVRTLAATARQEWGPALGGALIDQSPMLLRLLARQDLLLQVTLPPGITLPAPPRSASIETTKGSRAPITFVSPATHADPKIQGVSFFYRASAQSAVLPGMSVLAYLPRGPAREGVTVPGAAIVWWQDRAWVYTRANDHTYTRTEIPTDLPAPGGGFIVRDLPANAGVVTRGAQLLLSEEFRAQIQVGEDHE